MEPYLRNETQQVEGFHRDVTAALFCDEQGPEPLREGTANITQTIGKLKGAGEAAPQYEEGATQKNQSWTYAVAR